MIGLRIPPHDIDLERVVLGSLLMNPKARSKVKMILDPDDFYREAHSLIFTAILDADPPDIVTIASILRKSQTLEKVGGVDYLATLLEEVHTSAGVERHAKLIKDLSRKRQIIVTCQTVVEQAFNDGELDDLMTTWRAGFRQMQVGRKVKIEDTKALVARVFSDIERRAKDKHFKVGVECGLYEIDKWLNGFEPKTLTYLIGRPSIGKTALAISMAEYMANTGPVLFFSLEMGSEAITRRRLAASSGVYLSRIRSGNVDGKHWTDLVKAANDISGRYLTVIDSPKFKTVHRLIDLTETYAIETPLTAVFVDHIQLMRARGKFGNRHLEISFISDALKGLAKDLAIPVIALCQLNRDVEKRGNKRPILSDMRECVTAGTHIALWKGLKRPIKRICDVDGLRNQKVKTWDINAEKIKHTKPKDVFSTGKKKCLRIRLKSGKIIAVSRGSKFWNGAQWVRADELIVGDKVAVDSTEKKKVIRKGVPMNFGRTHFSKGLTVWNKGLTKDTDTRVRDIAEKTS